MEGPLSDEELRVPVAGTVLAGRYRVERLLGSGGVGIVLAAVQLDLGRRVAVKLLRAHHTASADARERLVREARTVAGLTSPHIAAVLDVGELESGEPYLVMEHLEGRDLASLLEEHAVLPVDLAVAYVLQACRGVAEAHASRVVHRDLKPHNLFLTVDSSGEPVIKVLDFGIAKPMAAGLMETTLTAQDAVVGSPAYMSPEQLRDARDVDERTDIWSLGVILFQLLTGTRPYVADNLSALCFKIAQEAPPRARTLRPEIDPGLDAVVARCLERDPDLRFESVVELGRALAPYARAQERAWAMSWSVRAPHVSAYPPATSRPRRRSTFAPAANGAEAAAPRARRRRPFVALLVAVGLLVPVVVGTAQALRGDRRTAPSSAVSPSVSFTLQSAETTPPAPSAPPPPTAPPPPSSPPAQHASPAEASLRVAKPGARSKSTRASPSASARAPASPPPSAPAAATGPPASSAPSPTLPGGFRREWE